VSISPSISPSLSPSISISPSISPSIGGSASPSISPSVSPSVVSSVSPSPSAAAGVVYSASASASPSASPSVSPSISPSFAPYIYRKPILYKNNQIINTQNTIYGVIPVNIKRKRIPSWNNLGRPDKPKVGSFGFNFQTNNLEYWNGSYWIKLQMKRL
jgi:hypothetical protein